MSFMKAMTAVGLVAIASIGSAKAADVDFYSDKTFWHDGLVGLTEVAGEAAGITVTEQEVTPTDKYQAYIQTSIAGGSAPAFYTWWNGNQLVDLADTGTLADLSEYWDAAIANGDFSEAQRELVSVDGTPYGVLVNVANWVMFYNKNAFEKAGIEDTPKTWEEFIAACEALKEAGFTPINAPASGGWMPFIWFSQLVLGTSPDSFVGLTDGSVAYDSPDVQEAFAVWSDMYENGYFSDPREQDPDRFFVDRSAAMYLIGDWNTASFVEAGMKPGEDFGTFLMPPVAADAEQAVIVEAAPIVVSKAALEENPDLGKAVQAMMGVDAANALADKSEVYNGNLQAEAPNSVIETTTEMIAEQKPRAVVRWWEAVPAQIQGDLVSAMGEFMFNPTPDQAGQSMELMQIINSDYWANQ